MKQQQMYLVAAVALIVVGAGAFFGGMQYQKMQKTNVGSGQFGSGQFGQGGSTRNRTFGQNGQNFAGANGIRPVSGEIIDQDEKSITVKLQDGSTKIILLSEQTAFRKSSEGSKSDVKIGEQVTAFGSQNQDGSITAQNISVGETLMFRGFGGQREATPSGMGK